MPQVDIRQQQQPEIVSHSQHRPPASRARKVSLTPYIASLCMLHGAICQRLWSSDCIESKDQATPLLSVYLQIVQRVVIPILWETAVRAIGLLTLVLLVLSYLAFAWDQTPEAGAEKNSGVMVEQVRWVRTSDGWEKANSWLPLPPVYQPPIHPLAIAGLQGMLSLAALLAFPGRAKNEEANFQGEIASE